MQALVVGAGIAGPTLAYWLDRFGHEVTLVERAPAPRSGGYVIDFWGAGFRVARRMGLEPAVRRRAYPVRELRVVGARGETVASCPVAVFDEIAGGDYVTLPRSELSAALLAALPSRVVLRFGDEPAALRDTGAAVEVDFRSGRRDRFDVVIGADGLHSRVRRLAFDPDDACEKYLGLKAAAFAARGYRPRDEAAYVLHTEVGRQISRLALPDDRTLFLLIFRAEDGSSLGSPLDQIRARFARTDWECAAILERLGAAEDVYFDRISQIRLPAAAGGWSRGRIALVGDAAAAVSLLAGQGASLAMTGAYVLAGELSRNPKDPADGFRAYERRLRPLVEAKQRGALYFGGAFAPRTRLGLSFRNAVIGLMRHPRIARWALGRDIRDNIELPDYEPPDPGPPAP